MAGEAYVHTLACMHAHMLTGSLSGPLGHLAACLKRGSNMRGHIKGSLCLCGCLECQRSTLPWRKFRLTLRLEDSPSWLGDVFLPLITTL